MAITFGSGFRVETWAPERPADRGSPAHVGAPPPAAGPGAAGLPGAAIPTGALSPPGLGPLVGGGVLPGGSVLPGGGPQPRGVEDSVRFPESRGGPIRTTSITWGAAETVVSADPTGAALVFLSFAFTLNHARWLDVLTDGTVVVAYVYAEELFLWERTSAWTQVTLPPEVGTTELDTVAIATFGADTLGIAAVSAGVVVYHELSRASGAWAWVRTYAGSLLDGCNRPSLAFSPSGSPILVYQGYPSRTDPSSIALEDIDGGVQWVVTTPSVGEASLASVAASPTGVAVVWRTSASDDAGTDGTVETVIAGYDGSGFVDPTTAAYTTLAGDALGEYAAWDPGVTALTNGGFVCGFQQHTGSSGAAPDIYAATFDGAAWLGKEQISDGTQPHNHFCQIASGDYTLAVWEGRDRPIQVATRCDVLGCSARAVDAGLPALQALDTLDTPVLGADFAVYPCGGVFGAVALLVWYDGTANTIQFRQGVVS